MFNVKNFLLSSSLLFSVFSSPVFSNPKVLKVGAIPDQNQDILDKRFNFFSKESICSDFSKDNATSSNPSNKHFFLNESILNLNKELRSAIVPTNDAFVELDYNAAELRVMLALLGQAQPKEDIHDWISKNIFDSKYDRDTTKKKVFAWLYNPKAKNKKLNEYLDRAKILEKFYEDSIVSTPYGRDIEVDEEKAVNYIIQSTTSDLFLTSAMKVDKMLEDKKSKIAFCVHDSLVLDVCHKEKDLINEIIEKFSGTKFADFKVNVSLGKNFGAMKKVR